MRTWLETHKPAASRRVHLLFAACMWSTVGSLLLFFGTRWTLEHSWGPIALPFALAAGAVKARLILDRAAARITERIRRQTDDRCLGGFLSAKSWVTVAVMMLAGRLLRGSDTIRPVIGPLYSAIGAALLLSSRNIWRTWRHCGSEDRP
jgi:hypothetical protein